MAIMNFGIVDEIYEIETIAIVSGIREIGRLWNSSWTCVSM